MARFATSLAALATRCRQHGIDAHVSADKTTLVLSDADPNAPEACAVGDIKVENIAGPRTQGNQWRVSSDGWEYTCRSLADAEESLALLYPTLSRDPDVF